VPLHEALRRSPRATVSCRLRQRDSNAFASLTLAARAPCREKASCPACSARKAVVSHTHTSSTTSQLPATRNTHLLILSPTQQTPKNRQMERLANQRLHLQLQLERKELLEQGGSS
jgi:hypothetical protein